MRLARTITVARILERDDFAKRFATREPISVSELLYPLMQAYDSVAIEADIELAAPTSSTNLLAGREVMAHYGLEPQVVLTTPLLLLSWDGEKMSSSRGTTSPLLAAPEEDVRPDDADPGFKLEDWWSLVAELPVAGGRTRSRPSSSSPAGSWPARTGGRGAAGGEHFTRVVREGQAPEDAPVPLPAGDPVHLPALLVEALGIGSTSEALRLITRAA